MALEFKKENHIAYIGMNRPKALNALDAPILRELGKAWSEVANDDDIRVAVLYSKLPDIFCAGMDLKTVIPVFNGSRKPANKDEAWLLENPREVFNSMLRERDFDKPVVSAINGLCLTGGFEMVMGTDIRIASEDAVFQMKEATYGIMPIGGSNVFLPRQIPLAAAKEILLMGQPIKPQRLLAWGFLNEVTTKDKLFETATRYAQTIADNGPLSVQGIMKCIRLTAKMDVGDAMNKELEIGFPIFSSEDSREGVKAFKEKRKANFKGK